MGLLLATTAWLAWESLAWPLLHDAPLMMYIAWLMEQGEVPYRDIFGTNFPGAYLVYRLVLEVFGGGDLDWRLFDLSWLALTDVVIVAFCRRFGGLAAASAAILFSAFHLANGIAAGGQRDFLLVAFLLAGTHLTARFCEDPRQLRWMTFAGAVLGIAVTVKPHVALLAGALAGFAGWTAQRSDGSWWKPACAMLAGGLAFPAAVCLWLWRAGGLGPFVEIVFDYLLPLYSDLGRASLVQLFSTSAQADILLLMLLLIAASSQRRLEGARALLLIGVVYGILHFVVQGKNWFYHWYPMLGFALPLATSYLEPARKPGQLRHERSLAMACLLVAAVVPGILMTAFGEPEAWLTEKHRRVSAIERDLGSRTTDSSRVQVFDLTEGGIHALLRLKLRQPTRFIYDFHFFHDVDDPYIQGLRRELLSRLKAKPPDFLLLFTTSGWPGPRVRQTDRLATFPALESWIRENYAVDVARRDYRILARR
jgi:hypothetical protein